MQCTTNNLKYTNTRFSKKIATTNFQKHIAQNSYPGRGIVLGKNSNNSWILIYWIMGRSTHSRNRIFKYEDGILRTEIIDYNLLKNPNFISYNVMLDLKDRTIISNGNHSDTIFEGLKRGESFISSLKSEKHEMDHPNYTPRIAGLLEQSKSIVSLIKISKSDFSFEHSSLQYFRYPLIQSGFGYCITTYMGDGNPPPCFKGDPILFRSQTNGSGNIPKTIFLGSGKKYPKPFFGY